MKKIMSVHDNKKLSFARVFNPTIKFVQHVTNLFKNDLVNYKSPKPVIIGNISSTQGTALIIHLIQLLQYHNIRPGVIYNIKRGEVYKSNQPGVVIDAPGNYMAYGDEAVLIHNNTGSPIVVDRDLARAAKHLTDNFDVDIILADHQVQNSNLQYDARILIDELNKKNLESCDLLINNQAHVINKNIKSASSVKFPMHKLDLESFKEAMVHAVTSIENPKEFFKQLREYGLNVKEHIFSAKHIFTAQDLNFKDEHHILMMEKDAIKCKEFANANVWSVPMSVRLPTETLNSFLRLVKEHILLKEEELKF